MDPFYLSISENLIASVIYSVAVLGIGFVWTRLHRRRLRRFFGVGIEKRFSIYVSHLRIVLGGALDTAGQQRSYAGPVMTQREATVATELANLFSFIAPTSTSDIWNRLLFFDVRASILPAPISETGIDQNSSFIAIGSPGYNSAAGLVQRVLWPNYGFINNNGGMSLPGIGLVNCPPSEDRGFIARLKSNDQWWFYAAGFGEAGTAGAVHYLVSHWKDLDNIFGENAFCILLAIDLSDFRRATVLSQRIFDPLTD